jgi:hypothetical protein
VLHLALAISKVLRLLKKGEEEREVGGEKRGIAKGTEGQGLVLWVSYLAH